ncbi:hypothetical protein [Pseudomonas kurunegalensis]|uniref:hypothetical protein n=1 Tax=Pseudomonas kurunegalensis TaxID=485880 RepID=UPI00211946E9|nr:hypothetical protein [Pseudomonas kurunegalensis]
MAKTFTAPFAQTPKTGTAVVTAALAGLSTDAPTGAQLLVTAGAEGAILTRLAAIPRGTVTASSLCVFLVKASAPAVYRLVASEVLGAYTASTTAAIPTTTFAFVTEESPLRLEAGDKLYVGSQVAQGAGLVALATWMDF